MLSTGQPSTFQEENLGSIPWTRLVTACFVLEELPKCRKSFLQKPYQFYPFKDCPVRPFAADGQSANLS
jgi:hypothetical protein